MLSECAWKQSLPQQQLNNSNDPGENWLFLPNLSTVKTHWGKRVSWASPKSMLELWLVLSCTGAVPAHEVHGCGDFYVQKALLHSSLTQLFLTTFHVPHNALWTMPVKSLIFTRLWLNMILALILSPLPTMSLRIHYYPLEGIINEFW